MNTIGSIVLEIERKKMLKVLDWNGDSTIYDGEIEALYQTLRTLLKQAPDSKTNQGV